MISKVLVTDRYWRRGMLLSWIALAFALAWLAGSHILTAAKDAIPTFIF